MEDVRNDIEDGFSLGNYPIGFEEYLKTNGSLTYRNKGCSMLPLLVQDRDLFTLIPKGPGRCSKYDVVLYKDSSGRYILHRVIKVLPDCYMIRGDNNYFNERYKDSDILAVMTSFVRKGREHSVTEPLYRVYSVLRCADYPLRSLYRKIRHSAGVMLRKMGLRK